MLRHAIPLIVLVGCATEPAAPAPTPPAASAVSPWAHQDPRMAEPPAVDPAQAITDPDEARRVIERRLRRRHRPPTEAAAFADIPGAHDLLLELATDHASLGLRARALTVLGDYDTPATRELLAAIATDDRVHGSVRAAAIRAWSMTRARPPGFERQLASLARSASPAVATAGRRALAAISGARAAEPDRAGPLVVRPRR